MNKDREKGPTGFFYSNKTRKSNRLQMTLKRQQFSSVIQRSWSTIGSAGVWNRGFPLSRPVFIHVELTGRRFNWAVFHYQVNMHLSLTEVRVTTRMPFNHHGLSSTDYHAKVHMQDLIEKTLSLEKYKQWTVWPTGSMGRTILALQNQSSFQKCLLTKLCKGYLNFP